MAHLFDDTTSGPHADSVAAAIRSAIDSHCGSVEDGDYLGDAVLRGVAEALSAARGVDAATLAGDLDTIAQSDETEREMYLQMSRSP